jgi:two-component system, NarL family, sensor histidine kinase UhpB
MCAKKVLILIIFLFPAVVGYSQTSVIDSLQRVIAMHSRDTNEIRALDHLSTEFMRKDMEKAKYYAYQQLALCKALGTTFGLSEGYAGLVLMHQGLGRLDSAQYYLNELEMLVKKFPSDKKALLSYFNTAGLFYKNQGKSREALPYLLEALRFIDQNKNKTGYAGQHLNIGNTYYNLGDFKNATDYHLRALTLFEEVKNKRGQSFCLANLGNVFFELEQYPIAEKYLLQSEKMKESLGDRRGVLTSWMSLGSVYQQTNKHELSMLYFNKALTRARELKLTMEEYRALFNIGSLLKTMKKHDESRKHFIESMRLARQGGDSVLVARIKSYLVALQNDMQKDKNQELTLLQNIEISSGKGALTTTAEGFFQLAEWYASRRQFEKAFVNLKKAQQLTDSLKGDAVVMQLKKLEEEYKNEKREKEITLLKKDQELQTLALSRQRVITISVAIALISVIVIGMLLVNRYRVMNRTKQLLEIERVRNNIARDLHDDIGSALSSINILSQVALHEKKENAQNYFQRIGEQSSRIMEDMSDMVWSINPRNDPMSEIIIRMREFASEILEPKNIEYHFFEKVGEGLTLNTDQRKNLFLIFKEAVNNAAKYSNARQIEISLHEEAHTLSMLIKDNGRGFDERVIKTGNGLRNLRERAREMNGTVTLKSKAGQGTEVELVLPLA